jgi:cytochrome c biogenesis protein CcdA
MKHALLLLVLGLLAYFMWVTSSALFRRTVKRLARKHLPWITILSTAIFGALFTAVRLSSINIV